MSDDAKAHDRVAGRMRDAVTAFTDGVQPAVRPSWDRIEEELDGAASEPVRRLASAGSQRFLIAAAIAVTIFLAAGAMVIARNGDDGLGLATTPTTSNPPTNAAAPRPTSIVALTKGGALVELDLDGRQQRVIFSTTNPMEQLHGKPAVGADGTIYAERAVQRKGIGGDECAAEIVAVPYAIAGGDVEVVAKVGSSPAVSPDGRTLAYVAPSDSTGCSPPTEWSVFLLDLETREPKVVPLAVHGEDWSPRPLEVAWTSETSLAVLAEQPGHSCPQSSPPSNCAIREYLAITDRGATVAPIASVRQTPGTIGPFDVLQVSATQSFAAIGGSTTNAGTAPIRLLGAGFRDRAMFVDESAVEVSTASGTTKPLFTIDSSMLDVSDSWGVPSFVPGQATVDASPDGDRVLVAARKLCMPNAYCLDATQPSVLVEWDGHQVRKLADGIVAAAFVTSAAPPAEPTSSTTAAATTTGTEWFPSPADATAIKEAYDLTFHGDFARLERGEEIRPSTDEGKVQNPDISTGVEVRINNIRYSDPDHASVDFELLKDGVDITAPSTGGAIRIGGTWFVTQATMCDLLARGGVPCPGDPATR
jgi:hypothetical protein